MIAAAASDGAQCLLADHPCRCDCLIKLNPDDWFAVTHHLASGQSCGSKPIGDVLIAVWTKAGQHTTIAD